MQDSGILVDDDDNLTIPSGSQLILSDDAATAPVSLTFRSAEPTTPSVGDVYADDGTNTLFLRHGLRRWDGIEWEDFGYEGGWIFIDAVNLISASSTIEFTDARTGAFDGTFDEYQIDCTLESDTSSNASLQVQVSESNSFVTGASAYQYAHRQLRSDGTDNIGTDQAHSTMIFAGFADNTAGASINASLRIFAADDASLKTIVSSLSVYSHDSSDVGIRVGTGMRDSAAASDGIRIISPTQDFAAGSHATLWGRYLSF